MSRYKPMSKCLYCGHVLYVDHYCLVRAWYSEQRRRISKAIEEKLNAVT